MDVSHGRDEAVNCAQMTNLRKRVVVGVWGSVGSPLRVLVNRFMRKAG